MLGFGSEVQECTARPGSPSSDCSASTIRERRESHASSSTLQEDEEATDIVMELRPRQPRRNRSTYFTRWMKAQDSSKGVTPEFVVDLSDARYDSSDSRERLDDSDLELPPPRPGSACNPYLAYPAMYTPPRAFRSTDSLESYDLLNDDDIPEIDLSEQTIKNTDLPSSRPFKYPAGLRSMRSFHSSHRAAAVEQFQAQKSLMAIEIPPPKMNDTSSHRFSRRLSVASDPNQSAPARQPRRHSHTSSLSTLIFPQPDGAAGPHFVRTLDDTPKKRRGSILNFFPPLQVTGESRSSKTTSRPSISASTLSYRSSAQQSTLFGTQYSGSSTGLSDSSAGGPFLRPNYSRSSFSLFQRSSSAITDTEGEEVLRPPPPVGSIRSRSSSPARSLKQHASMIKLAFTKSSASASTDADKENDDSGAAPSLSPPPLPLRTRMRIGRSKMKKLIIGGVPEDQPGKFGAVRRWCEGFGAVEKITRAQNGELHVYFRDPRVAETVCRVRAMVLIKGAGSVQLSWFTGSKPPL